MTYANPANDIAINDTVKLRLVNVGDKYGFFNHPRNTEPKQNGFIVLGGTLADFGKDKLDLMSVYDCKIAIGTSGVRVTKILGKVSE